MARCLRRLDRIERFEMDGFLDNGEKGSVRHRFFRSFCLSFAVLRVLLCLQISMAVRE